MSRMKTFNQRHQHEQHVQLTGVLKINKVVVDVEGRNKLVNVYSSRNSPFFGVHIAAAARLNSGFSVFFGTGGLHLRIISPLWLKSPRLYADEWYYFIIQTFAF